VTDELLDLAQSVVAEPPGEAWSLRDRGTETEVAAYEGEVESLTSPTRRGRHPRHRREADGAGSQVGFAWAGSLEPGSSRPPWPMRVTTRGTPRPTPTSFWPRRRRGGHLSSTNGRRVSSTPMEKKIAMAIELERATRAADPRVRQVSSADYSDSRWKWHWPPPPASRRRGGGRVPPCRSTPLWGRVRDTDRRWFSASAADRPIWCRTRRWTRPSCAPLACSGRRSPLRPTARGVRPRRGVHALGSSLRPVR